VEELKLQISELLQKVEQAINALAWPEKEQELIDLKQQMSAPDFWATQEIAKTVSSRYAYLENLKNNWYNLQQSLLDLQSLVKDVDASSLQEDISKQLAEAVKQYELLATELFLQGQYDQCPAIITINAGAGGDDAQDWAQMLERMYLRFAENQNWQVVLLSRSPGAEAGIKSATFKISGLYAYGYLKNEAGVHRLVRLSPYDSDHARHTSFAMLEVLPELKEVSFVIKDEDLKIDTYRSSGNGGQSVNTTDSAVRITHLPTGLVASCQNERSQLQNKQQAMLYLQSKLAKFYQAERDEEKKALKGEYTQAAWGNQIRSYVLHPYKLVKDHRSNYESTDPDKVLNGDLLAFIKARLQQLVD